MADSKEIDDGGPAFSGGLYEPQAGGSNDREPWNKGMSLRDYFAGQALAGMLANPDRVGNEAKFSSWAAQAYFFADAMIAARKGGEA